ncbi:hypothetical protein Glove_423g8 [Diversispora epigaea]|uniref:Uncharacterized protein n=1 Tax=Diversispora epigaea TaxID=1348612 RepID=A0A397GYT1_9GLOM|nr:hypothetical protein Glove_423g8 [Diversispora epigaea]
MSKTSSNRKNQTNYGTDRKKIRKKRNGIFKLKGSRLEFGTIEAGKEWEGEYGKKYIKDSLKLCKMFYDMLIQLSKECNNNEKIFRKLQIIGILNSANRLQLLTMDIPMRFICHIRRFEFQEVSDCINNLLLEFALKDILKIKSIITQTLKLIQESKSKVNDLDNSNEKGVTPKKHTTSPIVTMPSTCMSF